MNEIDDRLAGDAIWELFPGPAARSAPETRGVGRAVRRMAGGGLVATVWLFSPSLAVITACLAIAARRSSKGPPACPVDTR